MLAIAVGVSIGVFGLLALPIRQFPSIASQIGFENEFFDLLAFYGRAGGIAAALVPLGIIVVASKNKVPQAPSLLGWVLALSPFLGIGIYIQNLMVIIFACLGVIGLRALIVYRLKGEARSKLRAVLVAATILASVALGAATQAYSTPPARDEISKGLDVSADEAAVAIQWLGEGRLYSDNPSQIRRLMAASQRPGLSMSTSTYLGFGLITANETSPRFSTEQLGKDPSEMFTDPQETRIQSDYYFLGQSTTQMARYGAWSSQYQLETFFFLRRGPPLPLEVSFEETYYKTWSSAEGDMYVL
jgi:hypothetical protein